MNDDILDWNFAYEQAIPTLDCPANFTLNVQFLFEILGVHES